MIAILGISAFYHDSAAALIIDGEIVAAAQEERFSRKKHDLDYPTCAIDYVLSEAGLTLEQIDYVAFYDKPFQKFKRILWTYFAFAPRGVKQFNVAIPVWLRKKLFLKAQLTKELKKLDRKFHHRDQHILINGLINFSTENDEEMVKQFRIDRA